MHIYKHKTIDGRSVFTNHSEKSDRPDTSILDSNSLLKKLRPVKNPSKIRPFFRKMWNNFKRHFVVQHPDPIKINLAETIRPLDSSPFTIENLWKHYEHYLEKDEACPPGLKKCFQTLEEDQKNLFKIQRMESDKYSDKKARAETAFITKTIKKIQDLPVGKSRLLFLGKESGEELYCTITRTKGGFNLSFVGTGLQVEEGTLFLEGKEKVLRKRAFETIPTADFNNFLDPLITEWVQSGGVNPSNILNYTSAFREMPLSLDDYQTNSNRADKLFWNIVQSLPRANSIENTRSDIRSLRLRTELLVLYETFNRSRHGLDPQSKEYAELKKLTREVSSKVLLSYKKGYLSKKDLTKIKNHLLIIDEALESAKQKPSKIISSGGSLPKPILKDALNKNSIHSPQKVTPTSGDLPIFIGNSIDPEEISIPMEDPFSLSTYTTADTQEFIDGLNEIHSKMDILKNGTPEEKKWQSNEVFRLFFETPYFQDKDLKSITPLQAEEVRDRIIEFLDIITSSRNAGSLTEYDYHSILKMHNFIIFFNAQATGVWIDNLLGNYSEADSIRRDYQRLEKNWYKTRIRHPDFPSISSDPFSNLWQYNRGYKWNEEDNSLKFHSDPLNPHTRFYEHSDMSNAKILRSQHELMEKSKLILEQSRKVQKLLNVKSNSSITEFIENNAQLDHWLKPIHNPYLMGIFRKGLLSVRGSQLRYHHKSREERHYGGERAPEAFFDSLEDIFSHYMEELGDEPPDLSLLGTILELKHLSRTLRVEQVHTELLAFMHEKPHLLYNPEIRNFFDALFFSLDLDSKLAPSSPLTRRNDVTTYPVPKELYHKTIEEEIKLLDEQIKGPIEEPELLKARFETLLYYHEMLIRLKQKFIETGHAIDEFPDQKERLEELSKLCRTVPELNESLGYASRVLLREQLSSQEIDKHNIGAILNTFATIYTSSIDPMNVDPFFEQQMEMHWQLIASKLMEMNLEVEDFLPLFETIFSSKGIDFDAKAWDYEGNLVFKNEQYEVDLKTWDVKILNSPVSFGKLPLSIAIHPSIAPFLDGENLETLIVHIERVGNTKVYSFKDHQGTPTQIEDRKGTYTLYKKFNVLGKETWLQSLHVKPKGPKKPSKNFIRAFLQNQADIKKIEKGPKALPLFDNGLYINPKNKHGYIINGTKIDFEIHLTKNGHDLKCDSVKDLRGNAPSRSYQINNAGALKNKTLDFLKVFENQNQMILWSKRGELKRVELIRYGLLFEVKNGKLHCLTEPYTGYIVNAQSRDAEKKGIHHSLLLEHPDPKKPKKLFVASSDALETKEKSLLPKAQGLAKVSLALHYMNVVYKMVKEGAPMPSFMKQETLVFKDDEERLSFTAFDLRPYTGEICKKGPKESFELVKHASLTDPVHAASYLKRFPIKAALRDQKLLRDLVKFISEEGKDPAIKLKIALKLLNLLSEK